MLAVLASLPVFLYAQSTATRHPKPDTAASERLSRDRDDGDALTWIGTYLDIPEPYGVTRRTGLRLLV